MYIRIIYTIYICIYCMYTHIYSYRFFYLYTHTFLSQPANYGRSQENSRYRSVLTFRLHVLSWLVRFNLFFFFLFCEKLLMKESPADCGCALGCGQVSSDWPSTAGLIDWGVRSVHGLKVNEGLFRNLLWVGGLRKTCSWWRKCES